MNLPPVMGLVVEKLHSANGSRHVYARRAVEGIPPRVSGEIVVCQVMCPGSNLGVPLRTKTFELFPV